MAVKARTTVGAPKSDHRRRVPSVDALLRSVPGKKAAKKFGRPVVKHSLQATLNALRDEAAQGSSVPTDDIIMAVRTFAGRGVAFAETPASYYDVLEKRLGPVDAPVAALRELGILADRDHWGEMFQIFTKSMHVRRTLFLELIDRHGARTFGTSNITALYEAKERELTGVHELA